MKQLENTSLTGYNDLGQLDIVNYSTSVESNAKTEYAHNNIIN